MRLLPRRRVQRLRCRPVYRCCAPGRPWLKTGCLLERRQDEAGDPRLHQEGDGQRQVPIACGPPSGSPSSNNDGTLWTEHPTYVQLVDRVKPLNFGSVTQDWLPAGKERTQ
jgi:hypothetical protein